MNRLLSFVFFLCLGLSMQVTAVTYQGQLEDSSGPFTGTVPMLFSLYEAPEDGEPIAMFDAGSVNVVGGLFQVDLEFGGVFDGRTLWLEIVVDGSTLNQRQRISAVPQAHHATTTPAYCQSGGPLIGMRDDGKPLCGLDGVVSIDISETHACAVRDDGSVWCWGSAWAGRLGNGEASSSTYAGAVRVHVDDGGSDGGPLQNAVQVTTSDESSCALDGSGQVWCWGDNRQGQLGNGEHDPTFGREVRAVRTRESNGTVLDDAVKVRAAGRHACAVRMNDTVWCWGQNVHGQLGIGSTEMQTRAMQVIDERGSGLTGIAGVSVGEEHSCAYAGDGSAWCWGRGHRGQLGNGKSGDAGTSLRATRVLAEEGQPLESVAGIATQQDYSCALINPDVDGRIYCWGREATGSLGNGGDSGEFRLFPVEVRIDDQGGDGGPLQGVQRLAASSDNNGRHLCAVHRDGSLWCWGRNTSGQLGNGETTNEPRRAVRARLDRAGRDGGALSGISQVAVAGGQTCAHSNSGMAWCWGRNELGNLGIGWIESAAFPRATPVTRYVDPDQ